MTSNNGTTFLDIIVVSDLKKNSGGSATDLVKKRHIGGFAYLLTIARFSLLCTDQQIKLILKVMLPSCREIFLALRERLNMLTVKGSPKR